MNNRRFLQELYTFWTEVFQDQQFVESYASVATVQLAQLQERMANVGDVIGVSTIQPLRTQAAVMLQLTEELEVATVYSADGSDSSTVRSSTVRSLAYNDGYTYNGGAIYDAVVSTPYWEYALPDGITPQYLTTTLMTPARILSSPGDFEVVGNRIRFCMDPSSLTDINMQTVGDGPGTKTKFLFWSCLGFEDARSIQKQFGRIAQLTGTSSNRLKEALQIIWDLRVLGCSERNLARALCVLTDTDYYTGADEVVAAVFLEGGRRAVLTNAGIYTAPLEYTALVSSGQTLAEDTQLFSNYVVNAADASSLTANGLMLPVSLLGSAYRGPVYIPNEEVFILEWVPEDHTVVRYDSTDNNYQVRRESDGAILFTVDTAIGAVPYLNQPAEYYLALGGFDEDLQLFNAYLNASGFYTWLIERYARVPESLNPLNDLRRWLYADRVTLIELPATTADFRGSVMNALNQTWPAGSMLVFDEIITTTAETCSTAQMAEAQELFYVMDADETAAGMASDHSLVALTL